ncbi:hypothetical protein KM043_000839 [Ampulex compressa]|nr:hypothetical protein KM043_000839 [Ampulex compressa]
MGSSVRGVSFSPLPYRSLFYLAWLFCESGGGFEEKSREKISAGKVLSALISVDLTDERRERRRESEARLSENPLMTCLSSRHGITRCSLASPRSECIQNVRGIVRSRGCVCGKPAIGRFA